VGRRIIERHTIASSGGECCDGLARLVKMALRTMRMGRQQERSNGFDN
jgi:hypothetical protein